MTPDYSKPDELKLGAKNMNSAKISQNAPDWPRIVRIYIWMIASLKHVHDLTGLNEGNYSPELEEAIDQIPSLMNFEEPDVHS